MANIYLRVPSYVAQFYRALDPEKVLAEAEPYKFCRFQHEYMLMQNCLILINENEQTCTWCYSQRAWRNILQGKPPTGGKVVIQRDKDCWPCTKELCAIIGEKSVAKMEAYDYLAIEIPDEIIVGDQVRLTNASYSLHQREAIQLQQLLRDEFVHTFLDWVIQDRRYCNKMGVMREIGTTIERFFERYHIFIGGNKKERESMYRMSLRWIYQAHLLPNDRVDFSDSDIHYVSDKEQATADHYDFKGEIEREIKKANKCKVVNKKMLKSDEKTAFSCST